MFIGHFGVALAAKRFAPHTSLGTLFFGAEFADLLWPILLLLGVEHVRITPGITRMQPFDFYDYPVSHSLLTTAFWAAVVGIVYYARRRYWQGALSLGALVLSHWILDFIMHRPDLPVWPNGPKVGLGLWNSWALGVALEVLTFGIGLILYVTSTSAKDRVGQYAFWSLMILLFFGWISSLFGVPPTLQSLAWGALTMWIVIPWGSWVDRHRVFLQKNKISA
jgi:hypothetical protein